MKIVTRKTVDGKTLEFQIPETPEEERQIQQKMTSGEIDDGHAFSDDEEDRIED